MTIARAIRLLLVGCTLVLLAWAFLDVGRRAVARWLDARERPVRLTLLHWGSKEEDAIVQELVDRYMAMHPRVHVTRINAGDFRSKLKTMMSAGTPPDLFYLPPDLLPELASLELIAPIDDRIAADVAAGNGALYDDYFPILLQAWRYDVARQVTGEGPIYGLPKDSTTAVFYANLDLLDAAGVDWRDIQRGGWTWDRFEAEVKKIHALRQRPEFADRRIFGGHFGLWPDPLRNILWTFGTDFFATRPDGTADFRDVILDEPPAQRALEMIRRTRLEDRTIYNATGIAKDGGAEFLSGSIGVYGPVGRWEVPRLKDVPFRWDVLPIPAVSPEHRASQLYLTAWTMSPQTRHPDECFRLMKFLCGPEGAAMQSQLGLAIPPLRSVAESEAFLSPPGIPPHNARLFLDAMEHVRLQQVPREAEWGRIVDDRIKASLQQGDVGTLENARQIEAAWLAELDSPLRQQPWPRMRWNVFGTLTAGLLATSVAVLWWRARREKLGPLDASQERAGFLFVAPWLAGFIALTLGPMLVSLLLSFTRWSGLNPLDHAESVGAANYRQLFFNDPTFYQSLKVTAYYVVLAVPITQVAALGVALLMNLRVRGITVFRTIYFVPSVVSGVALAVLWLQIFNDDFGLLNRLLAPVLAPFGLEPPNWFGTDAARFAIPAFVIMSLWGVGGGMIIYLAGLKGIPRSLYEASTIDGAGPWRRLFAITLPMLSPLIFYNVVMGLIGSFQVFTQAYVMTGAGPNNATLFYVLSLYRHAFEFHNMGYASAMAWVLFVLVLLLTLLVFRSSRSLVYYEGLKT
jgi:multiple sugar transport system permease protein